ncbi:MAG TPA: hypothetical protein VFU72_15845, partial [Nitrolancea sp.]|nr:hypothetical protein [Nitrolancea sp.]
MSGRSASLNSALLPRPASLAGVRQQRLERPVLIPLAIGLAMLAVTGTHVAGAYGLLFLTAALFLLVPISPAWALVPVLAVELTTNNFYITSVGMSERLAMTLIACLVGASLMLRTLRSGDPRLKRVLLPAILLIVIAAPINLMTSGSAYAI